MRLLPLFTPRDEQLARTILSSLALHDTLVDPAFVRSLLDPDQRADHVVDFGFLRRLVIALSSRQLGDTLDPRVSGERRDARTALAQAVASLSVALGELPALSDLELAQGAARLRQRGLAPLPVLDGANAAPPEAATGEEVAATPPSPFPSDTAPPAQLSRPAGWSALTRTDRAVLTVLYAAASQPSALEQVDQIAHALRALRLAERREPAPVSARAAVRASMPPALDPPARVVDPGRREPTSAPARATRTASAPAPDQTYEPDAPPGYEAAPRAPHAMARPERIGAEPSGANADVARAAPHAEAAPSREPLPLRQHATGPGADASMRWPDARPDPSAAAQPSLDARHSADNAAEVARAPHDSARSYGSSSQLAARVVGSYARIASESAFPAAMGARGPSASTGGALPGSARQGLEAMHDPPPMPTLTRPLNGAELLGVSSLVRELKARAARTARLRKRHMGTGHVRPLETLREAAYDAEADDPVLDAAPRRRRARWHLLLERRKRRRTKER